MVLFAEFGGLRIFFGNVSIESSRGVFEIWCLSSGCLLYEMEVRSLFGVHGLGTSRVSDTVIQSIYTSLWVVIEQRDLTSFEDYEML